MRLHWVRVRVSVGVMVKGQGVRVRVRVRGYSGDYLLPLGAGAHGAIEREAARDQPVRVVADLVRGKGRGRVWVRASAVSRCRP